MVAPYLRTDVNYHGEAGILGIGISHAKYFQLSEHSQLVSEQETLETNKPNMLWASSMHELHVSDFSSGHFSCPGELNVSVSHCAYGHLAHATLFTVLYPVPPMQVSHILPHHLITAAQGSTCRHPLWELSGWRTWAHRHPVRVSKGNREDLQHLTISLT